MKPCAQLLSTQPGDFEATCLSPLVGARVTGVDLRRPLAAHDIEALRALMRMHRLLLFPDQQLSADAHERIVSAFGPVVGPRSGGLRHVLLAFEADDSAPFHCDYSFTRAPLPFVSLYGVEVDGEVATTAFVNGVTACRELPPDLRARITARRVLHASDVIGVGQRSTGSLRSDATMRPHGSFHGTHHPAILRHPETGDEILFINENLCVAIDGLPKEESDALLSKIFEHLYEAERVYEHRWRQGDLLIFDNLALQHSRMRGPARKLRRVIVSTEPLEQLLAQLP